MTKKLIETPIETLEYNFVIENALQEENRKLKEAINDVLDALIDENGVKNLIWIKNRLLDAVK